MKKLLVVICIVLCLALQISTRAQTKTTLSIAIPDYLKDALTTDLIHDFEAQHTETDIVIVTEGNAFPPLPVNGLDKHLEAVENYASSADVLYMRSSTLSPFAINAGYFLDLSPLVASDNSLNVDDFYPAVWQSFQWDKGLWALPTVTNLWVLTYDAVALDKAGLAYPTDHWTLDDLLTAVQALAVKNEDGTIKTPAMILHPGFEDSPLIRAFAGHSLADASVLPALPKFSTPELERVIDALHTLQQEGFIVTDSKGQDDPPLTLSPQALFYPGMRGKHTVALFPGNTSIIDAQGFALSSGTQQPELAYELAKFLATRAELANHLIGIPARKSLWQAAVNNNSELRNVSPERQSLVNTALANAIPSSDLNFGDYAYRAVQLMQDGKLNAQTALQQLEIHAIEDVQAATSKKQHVKVIVATPVPTAIPKAEGATIRFLASGMMNRLPNGALWQKVIDSFVADNPDVAEIVLASSAPAVGYKELMQKYDCLISSPDMLIGNADLSQILNIDPFLQADKSFDKANFAGNTLASVTIDNKIWAYPLELSPMILRYKASDFEAAHIRLPTSDWTINTFVEDLKLLKTDAHDSPPLWPVANTGVHWLMFIAAFGGLPIDYRTHPVTINFTAPETVEAIRQLLDLAKQGYITYKDLSHSTITGGKLFGAYGLPGRPIYVDALSRLNSPYGRVQEGYSAVGFPRGSKYNAVFYDLSAAFISAKSAYPDICYRWISSIAHHAELFTGMPVYRPLLDDPALITSHGQDMVNYYRDFDKLLQDPNTVEMRSDLNAFPQETWLYEAFDRYVLEGADLETALKDAEVMALAYSECAKDLPPIDRSTQDKFVAWLNGLWICAEKADPRRKATQVPK